MHGMKPTPQAMRAARATWQETPPSTPPQERMELAVEAAFAQVAADGGKGWQAVVFLLGCFAFILGLLALTR